MNKKKKGKELGELRVGQTGEFAGLIIREHEPENLEWPFSSLSGFITPADQFFVRSHFPVPALTQRGWRLRVEGLVKKEVEIGYDDLISMPSRTVTAVLECAGNSRIFLEPKAAGVQWELGAVGNAEWTGVSLRAVLERAGVRSGAVDVILEGADEGEILKEPRSPGKIRYARSLPLEKAMDKEVLLAYRMNGQNLTAAHGFPCRAIVPGWYGMASVKWLRRIVVTDQTFRGYFQTSDYSYWEERDGLPIQLLPVGEMEVKALVARPALHEVVPADSAYRIHGAAWAGEATVSRIQVSMDGGRRWRAAQWIGEGRRNAWRLWDYKWRTPSKPGLYRVMARAIDDRGRRQPMKRDPNRGSYIITHVLPIEVEVRRVGEV